MNEEIEKIIHKAEEGDTEAMVALGIIYESGDHGVEKDYDEAAHWLSKAAHADNVGAMLLLGFAYLNGRGVDANSKETVRWFRRAAEDKGDARGMRLLGVAYKDGEGVEQNFERAAYWLKRGAVAGDAPAMLEFGVLLWSGKGVEKDAENAVSWITEAANKGDVGAMLHLGVTYRKDSEKSASWLHKAAKKDEAAAMLLLAFTYRDKGDAKKSASWARKAVKKIDSGKGQHPFFAPYMHDLGIAYLKGDKIKKNIKTGIFWLQKAVDRGHVESVASVMLAKAWADGNFPFDTKFFNLLKMITRISSKIKTVKNKEHSTKESNVFYHYTSMQPLREMLGSKKENSNFLRLYNPVFFNDPEEGKPFTNSETSIDYFFDKGHKTGGGDLHTISFNGKDVVSFYICCFSGNGDDLNLWRAYGQNGDGYSFSVKATRKFRLSRKKERSAIGAIADYRSPSEIKAENYTAVERFEKKSPKKVEPIEISRVLYGLEKVDSSIGFNRDQDTYENRSLGKYLDDLKNTLNALDALDEKCEKIIDVVKSIIRLMLADLLYLYKNEAYESESEYRIVWPAGPSWRDSLRDDKNKNPPRHYIETIPFLFKTRGGKITIGPRVFHTGTTRSYFEHIIRDNGWEKTTVVEVSKVPYK